MTDNPPAPSESLSISLSAPSHFPFAFLDLFVSLLPFNKPSLLCPFSPWSLISPVLTPLLPRCLSFGFSLCFYLPVPLLCCSLHIPHLPKSISAPVRHVLSSQRIRPLGRCRKWTMTYFPLSVINSGWGRLKPGSEPALVSA